MPGTDEYSRFDPLLDVEATQFSPMEHSEGELSSHNIECAVKRAPMHPKNQQLLLQAFRSTDALKPSTNKDESANLKGLLMLQKKVFSFLEVPSSQLYGFSEFIWGGIMRQLRIYIKGAVCEIMSILFCRNDFSLLYNHLTLRIVVFMLA